MTGDVRPRVVVSERLGSLTAEEERLAAVALVEQRPLRTRDEIMLCRGADVFLIGAVEPFDAQAIGALTACRGIVRRGAGVDNVDVDAATQRGIIVANVPDATVEEVSDHALALALSLLRRVVVLDRAVRRGDWLTPTVIEAQRRDILRINEAVLGIVGYGRIGRRLAEKAAPLFGQVLVYDPLAPATSGVDGVSLATLTEVVRGSDVVSLHAPLTDTTRHLFDDELFQIAKPGQFLVNTARGALIDEAALIRAVESGRIAGAALDVVDAEPIGPGHPLLGQDRIVTTAHSAATSRRAGAELRKRAVDAVIAILDGRPPASAVNQTGAPS